MRAIATLQLPEGTSIAFARDVFMFSFYMRGMPFVDIAYLRKKDLKNKMLAYSRKKTNQYLTVEWVCPCLSLCLPMYAVRYMW